MDADGIKNEIINFKREDKIVKVQFRGGVINVDLKYMEGYEINKNMLSLIIYKKYKSQINEILSKEVSLDNSNELITDDNNVSDNNVTNDNVTNDNRIVANNNVNSIGDILKEIGFGTMAVGVFLGLIIGGKLGWVFGIATIITTLISGVLFIGFSEVIMLLKDIKENTSK